MKIRLNESDYRCGLTECYEHIAVKAGYKPTQHTSYDCRRVCVSKNIQDAWYSYYHERAKEKDPFLSDREIMYRITMLLLMNGAKIQDDLKDNEVRIESGFATEEYTANEDQESRYRLF